MSEELNTQVESDNVQPVDTDTEAETSVEAKSEATPKVEVRDGKTYVDGVRVYSRDEVNKVGFNARKEVETKILQELEVDSLDKVKSVVSQLRDTGEEGLDVQSLRDAVKKREQTVEELRAELEAVKTDYALRSHIGNLKDNMPSAWNAEQKQAVVDLMKARDMLHISGDTFAIRNGDSFITTDGETPDYAQAVKVVGSQLGLPFAKKGVETYDTDRKPMESSSTKTVDESRVKSDTAYRNAYVQIRSQNRSLARTDITDAMIKQQMKKNGVA